MGLGGAITNLLSLVAKLLPVADRSAQAPSSSSAPPAVTHQIESDVERSMEFLKRKKVTLNDAEGREMSDESVKLLLKELKLLDHSSTQAPSSSSAPPAKGDQIETDLQRLMEMLERIKATLYAAEEREIMDDSVKLWLKELRRVAYDAEDVLGEYHYEVLRAQVEARDAAPRKRKQVQMSDGMFDQIKQIKGRFDEICKDRIALRLFKEDGLRRCEVQIAPAGHFVVESDIFGREREKERLIDLLSPECHDDKLVSVVTVVGTGGLGKTTLAQLVYNDQRIRQRFSKFGWIYVSEDFNVERLTRELIECITGDSCGLTNFSVMQNRISEEIRGERILLVLDDVWNENISHWEKFRALFWSAALVKILVTTRNELVARIVQTEPSFNLGYLSEEQCWQLFQHYAFGETNRNEGSELLEIGKQIMKKCGMLPLAAKSIASLLRHEEEEESWREILESELWKSDAGNEIFPPLQISYVRLPTYLKSCFLYCSVFPKDHCFTGGELVSLWNYQGYIESDGMNPPEKIGQEYAKQMWERSFFEGTYEVKKFHKAKFKLHDMVHDLARFNSKNECYSIEANKVLDFPNELHHLHVDVFGGFVEPLPLSNFTALRTLITGFFAGDLFNAFDFSKAQKLRALVLRSRGCEEVLSWIVNLKHIRYLFLENLSLERLLEGICSLYSLQNLTLKNCSVRELPKSIENLVSLEELVIDDSGPRTIHTLRVLPASFCQLKALTKLILINCILEELPIDIGSLKNLQTLKITGSNIRVLPVSFCQLKALTNLKLIWCSKLEEIPIDIGSLTNLQILKIVGSKLKVLPVSLCQLKVLTKLKLPACFELEELPIDIGSLTNLQTLKITHSNIRVLPVSLCQLKALTKLKLIQCSKLEEIPTDIGNLTNLQILKIVGSKLRVLPVSLCQLKALTKLKLPACFLEELPVNIGSLTNLRTLKITASNDLRVLPMSLCQLKALTELELYNCSKLEELPIDIGSLTNLRTLIITGYHNSVSSPPLNLSKLKGIRTLQVMLECETIGWLGDCIDLGGTLILRGLNNIASLTDVQCANLVSMHNLECLKLLWGLSNPYLPKLDKNEVSLEIKSCQNTFPDEQNDFSLIHRLQPHPNLRKLYIEGYGGIAFPNWIGDPISCASLERIEMKRCRKLTFLPFGSLHKLKYLVIYECCSLRFLPAESLPLELEELDICDCEELIFVPGIQKLKSLVKLHIKKCVNLQLLVMDAKPSVELTMHTNESSDQNSLLGLRNLTSLRSLKIIRCIKLQLLANVLPPIESCEVKVLECPRLKDWCLQHSITYKGNQLLDWNARKRIAVGTARGLQYLHEQCNPKIIHRDVKAANVLLDARCEAVVGDFGLAKLLDHSDSHVTTAVRGTVGHIAPEYLSTGQSSDKTDVFGFGILLLELVTGQKAIQVGKGEADAAGPSGNVHHKGVMLDWVRKAHQEKRLDLLVDHDLDPSYDIIEVSEMVQVALLCTQYLPSHRPRMSDVVRMLEGDGLADKWEATNRLSTPHQPSPHENPMLYHTVDPKGFFCVQDECSSEEALSV